MPGQPPIHLFHHTFARGGGMERYALDISRGLKEAGRKVIFHCIKLDSALAAELGIETVHYKVAGFPRKLRDYRFFCKVARAAPALEGVQISLCRLKVRDAVTCGGTHCGYISKMRRLTGPFDLIQIWMEREGYRAARQVVAHSRLCAGEIAEHYRIPKEKIAVLHPPVGAQFSAPKTPAQRSEIRRQFGLPEDKTVFLFPSTGHKRKGLGPVVQALAGFQDRLVLAIAGKPPGRYSAPFVRHLGYVGDMRNAYAAADFTMLGSFYEPFGLVGIESILSGTKLVFEKNAGCLEVIKPAAAFTFSVADPESIRRAVTAAINQARKKEHFLDDPRASLDYDPDVALHVRKLLQLAGEKT
jgi:glycosyltransferase involved in cell wall biosynthesis